MENLEQDLRRRPISSENGTNPNTNNSTDHKSNTQESSTNQQSSFHGGAFSQNPEVGPYMTAAEYSQAVQQWLWQYHMCNQMNWLYMTFPLYASNFNMGWPSQPSMGQARVPQSGIFPGMGPQFTIPPPAGGQAPPRNGQVPQAGRTQAAQNGAVPVARGQEYRIPQLWKRIAAEFIDFFLLFVVKLGITILFVEYIGLVDLRHYDLEYLMTTDMDYNTAFAMTSELVAMEIVNRVLICIFETICLRKGLAGSVGGTTPGKRMMGLKVISCREVMDRPGNKILVVPAGDIGTWNAFVRSLIKNFSLAFFFPVCLTVFFFQHNRAAYDIISNCIVVETREFQPPRWR